MSDHAVNKVAQAIIRLIAFALVVVSLLLYALDALSIIHRPPPGNIIGDIKYYSKPPPLPPPGILGLQGVPLLAGIVLALASKPLAARFTKDLD